MSSVLDCRLGLGKFFGGYGNGDPRYVTFCSGVTEALNVVLKGFLRNKPGVRVVSTSMEHNAVVRPLRGLEADAGIKIESLQCDSCGALSPDLLKKVLIDGGGAVGMVVISHASNVCGTIQPLEEIASLCREFSVPLVVDGAQTGGVVPVSVSEGISAFCFAGHKGLMGPQGLGGVVWNPEFASRVAPLVEGGTGSYSHLETQPLDMPDKFEAGTPNLPGIAGLGAALGWLNDTGIKNIAKRERELGERLLEGLKKIGAVLYGRPDMAGRVSVFAFNMPSMMDNGVLADGLSLAGFETRPGLHCAPLAHRTLGTFPLGSLRVSPGFFNTLSEIDAFCDAVRDVIKNHEW
jgi:selenocysteine lyase/cysteine desulfurase